MGALSGLSRNVEETPPPADDVAAPVVARTLPAETGQVAAASVVPKPGPGRPVRSMRAAQAAEAPVGVDDDKSGFESMAVPGAVDAPAASAPAAANDFEAAVGQAIGGQANAFAQADSDSPAAVVDPSVDEVVDEAASVEDGLPALDQEPESAADQIEAIASGQGGYDWSTSDPRQQFSHRMLLEALASSGMDEVSRVKMANEYHSRLGELRDKLKLNDLSKAEQERLLDQAAKEAANQTTGGGFLASLVSKLLPSKKNGGAERRAIEALGNERRNLIDQQNGVADGMRERIRSHMQRGYQEAGMEAARAASGLYGAIDGYNDAFLGTPAAAAFLAEMEKADWPEGMDRTAMLKAVREGKGPEAVQSAFEAARTEAAGDEAVVEAKVEMEKRFDDYRKSLESLGKKAEGLQKNFPDSFDIEEAQKSLDNMLDMADRAMPDPIDDDPENGLKARMRKFAEEMRNAIIRLIESISKSMGFGR